MSTPKAIAILLSVARSGWDELVHHFETVAGSLSNSAASHLLVRLRSARTTFMRFKSFISIFRFIAFATNLVRIYGIRMKISFFSHLNVFDVITNDLFGDAPSVLLRVCDTQQSSADWLLQQVEESIPLPQREAAGFHFVPLSCFSQCQ